MQLTETCVQSPPSTLSERLAPSPLVHRVMQWPLPFPGCPRAQYQNSSDSHRSSEISCNGTREERLGQRVEVQEDRCWGS